MNIPNKPKKDVLVYLDGKVFEGKLLGFVLAWAFCKKDNGRDIYCSNPKAELRPEETYTTAMWRNGYELRLLEDHPKILLDDGRTVYGCQVYWMPTSQAESSDGWNTLVKNGIPSDWPLKEMEQIDKAK